MSRPTSCIWRSGIVSSITKPLPRFGYQPNVLQMYVDFPIPPEVKRLEKFMTPDEIEEFIDTVVEAQCFQHAFTLVRWRVARREELDHVPGDSALAPFADDFDDAEHRLVRYAIDVEV